ncbi:MAG: hypothetical protein GHCLOJNM_03531 [bacterium]|nr:hypothetical protein [bacterium]
MRRVFADTFYYLAMANERDAAHSRAREYSSRERVLTVTTEWVLTEVANNMTAIPFRGSFLRILQDLEINPYCRIIPSTQELFRAGVDLFSRRPDKEWSLTDCISFVVMEREGLSQALTGDHHFVQAGFEALLA